MVPSCGQNLNRRDNPTIRSLDTLFAPETVGSFALTQQVSPSFEVAPEAGEVRLVAPAPVFVGALRSELREGDTTVGRGDLRCLFDVLTELVVYLVGVGPRPDSPLTGGESNSALMLTEFAVFEVVLLVRVGTSAFTGVHTVL